MILKGNQQILWLGRMEREYNNLNAALTWCTDEANRASQAMEMGLAMHAFWLTHGRLREARRWLGKILALDPYHTPIRADLLRYAGDYASSQGDIETARELEEEAMNISKALGDEAGIYYSLDGMARLAGMQGDYKRAADLLEQTLAYRRRIDDPNRLTTTLNNLALATRELGDLEKARKLHEEALIVTKKNNNNLSLTHALDGLAEIRKLKNEIPAAILLHRECLQIRMDLGDKKGIAFTVNALGLCHLRDGNPALAARLGGAAERIREEIGSAISPAKRAEYDEFIWVLQKQLGEAKFKELWNQGMEMSHEKVLDLVLGDYPI